MKTHAPSRAGMALEASGAEPGQIVPASQVAPSGRRAVTKFKPATITRILKLIEKGMPLSLAAPAVGVAYRTFCHWRQENRDFAEQVEAAISKGIESRLKVIENSMASKDEAIRLRAACWMLEHANSEHFSKTRVQAEVVGHVTVETPDKPPFDFAAYTRLCNQVFGVPDDGPAA